MPANNVDFAQFTKAAGTDVTSKANIVRSAGGPHIQTGDALVELQNQINRMRLGLGQIFISDDGGGIQSGDITTADFAPGYTPIQNVNVLPALPNTAYPVGMVVYLTTNGKLYRNVANVWVTGVTASDIITPLTTANFSSTIQPVQISTFLPALPNPAYPQGTIIFLTTDGKLYRNFLGTSWTSYISAVDITVGQITTTQITPGAVTTPLLAAGAVQANNIAANAIIAGKIAANAVIAGTIAVGAVNASDITVGTLTVTVKITNASSSGLVTDITQGTEPSGGFNFGIQFKQTSTNARTSIGYNNFLMLNSANAQLIAMLNSGGAGGFISLSNSSGNVRVTESAANAYGGSLGVQAASGSGSVLIATNGTSNSGQITIAQSTGATNFVPVVATAGHKIAYGANQLSSGQVTINTGLTSIVSFVATIGTGGGTPSEYVASSGVSGGNITVNSSNAASSLFVAWFAVGLI